MSDTLARAKGFVLRGAWRQWLYAAEVAAAAWIGQFWGINGLACGVSAALVIHYVVMILFARNMTGVSLGSVAFIHLRHLSVALLVGAAAWTGIGAVEAFRGSEIIVLLAAVLLSAVTWGALWSAVPKLFGDEGIMLKTSVRSTVIDVLRGFPLLFAFARSAIRALRRGRREARTVWTIGPRILRRRLYPSRNLWRSKLPVQKAFCYAVRDVSFADNVSLRKIVPNAGLCIQEGGDAVYLSPTAWRSSPLAEIARNYPSNAALKISKNVGDRRSQYTTSIPGRRAQRLLSDSHDTQMLTFNFLHQKRLAPRLYDLIEMKDDFGTVRCGYVVEHVEGEIPSDEEYEQFMASLKALVAEGWISLDSGDGWKGMDFTKTACNGNLLFSPSHGRALYVDPHNFSLNRYHAHLERIAREAAMSTHFGDCSLLFGSTAGKYLYQAIPGIDFPAKRSPRDRMKVFDRLFADAGLDLHGKVILDVGCNLGLMGAELLGRGAAWLHGWDMPDVVAMAERVLLSVGCTRFSLTPILINSDIRLLDHLPPHILDGSPSNIVISYLAIRGHVGWLPALRTVPWKYMMYEGHQNDAPLATYIEDLRRVVPVEVVSTGSVVDANSTHRTVAIIKRLPFC